MDRTIQEAIRLVGTVLVPPKAAHCSQNEFMPCHAADFFSSEKSVKRNVRLRPYEKSATKPIDTTHGSLVVLDGKNLGFAFGQNSGHGCFDAQGILIVLDYYLDRGVEAVALLPRYLVKSKNAFATRRRTWPALRDKNNAILKKLHKEKRLAFIESPNRYVFYILRYAMIAKGDIISNYKFRNEEKIQKDDKCYCQLRNFLDGHLIHYTFILNQFIPSPDPVKICKTIHYPRARVRPLEKIPPQNRNCCPKHKGKLGK